MSVKTLAETVPMMNSEDYKERFKAEYQQVKFRYEKLNAFTTKIVAADMAENEEQVPMPKHDCPTKLLVLQKRVMKDYLQILELRAVIEKIEL